MKFNKGESLEERVTRLEGELTTERSANSRLMGELAAANARAVATPKPPAVKAPAPAPKALTTEERFEAAMQAARGIEEPYRRALAIGEAKRMLENES
jgi:hypothetical protein